MIAAAMVMLTATAASAQSTRPPIEAGIGFGAIASVPYEDFGVPGESPSADVRVTVPVSPRFSLEGQLTIAPSSDRYGRQVEGLYLIAVKQRIARGTRGGFHPFVSYGAAGYFEHRRVNPYSVTLPSGDVTTYPGFSYTSIDQPYGTFVGGGVQHAFSRHVAIRGEAQLLTFLWIPLGVRYSTSVSIPLGRRYSMN
jgi:hypothetical protein